MTEFEFLGELSFNIASPALKDQSTMSSLLRTVNLIV